MSLPVDQTMSADGSTSQGEQGLVEAAFTLVAQTQPAKLAQAADGVFDDAALLSQAAAVRGFAPADHRQKPAGAQGGAVGLTVVGRIGQKPAGSALAAEAPAAGRRPGRRVHQGQKHRHVVSVGRANPRAERHPRRVAEQVVFTARLTPVRGVWPGLVPPKTARTLLESTAARRQSMSLAWSKRLTKAWWSCSHTPAAAHALRCLWQAEPQPKPSSLGKLFQPMPVRSTKRMPSSARRGPSGWRPAYRSRRGLGAGKSGSNSAQSASLTRLADLSIDATLPEERRG